MDKKTLPTGKNYLLMLCGLFMACGQHQEPSPAPADAQEPAENAPMPPITLSEDNVIPPPNAKLKLRAASFGSSPEGAAIDDIDVSIDHKNHSADFHVKLRNFELKRQTPDAKQRGCANSKEGQHLHFIVNNQPYIAKYDTVFTENLPKGHNVILTFLSRSYHESIKDLKAFKVSELYVDGQEGVPKFDYHFGSTLFYSRPKGDYKQSDGDRVLLDFYLLNTTLADNGYKVRATIDGEAYLLTRWAPYFIEGLELGEHTVRLELIDNDGNLMPGPFNDSGPRTFRLLAG